MLWAPLYGVGCAVLIGLFVGSDYLGVRGVPRERAHVVRVYFTGERTACGPRAIVASDDEEASVFKVDDPRPGFSSTFVVRGCPDSFPVGFTGYVVRTGPADEDVVVDPPNGSDVPAFAVIVGAVAWMGVVGYYLLVDGLEVLWHRRKKS